MTDLPANRKKISSAAKKAGLYEDLAKLARFFARTMFDPSADIVDAICACSDAAESRQVAHMWYDCAMDTVRRHFAPGRCNTLQGSMCAIAIDGFVDRCIDVFEKVAPP